jgi:hypothetical protein
VSPDPRHRPQGSRVQHRSPGRARQYHAGRVFSLQAATRLVSSTRRPVGSAATPRSPGRPQPCLEAVAAVLHGQARPALLLHQIPRSSSEIEPRLIAKNLLFGDTKIITGEYIYINPEAK